MPKQSTGKVKLRRANGTLMLTIPKTIQPKVEGLLDKSFEATYTQTDSLDLILFTRRRFKVQLGG